MCVHKIIPRRDQLGRQVRELSFVDPTDDKCDYLELDSCTDLKIEDTKLSIMQLNIRGLVSKQNELLKLINVSTGEAKLDLIILQETWVTKNNEYLIDIPGYKYHGTKRPNRMGGGVAVLVNSSLKSCACE